MNHFIGCISTVLIGIALSASVNAANLSNCIADLPQEAHVYSTDFKWSMTLEEIRTKADEMYQSDKRLAKRAYFDEQTKSFVFPNEISRGGLIKIPETFIKAVQKHVEKAFQRKYVDALLFPDMGHSHFLVPHDYYNTQIAPLPVTQFNLWYERMFDSKDVKVVYHTAEQLKMLGAGQKPIDDKQVQWRYFTRNLIGHNNTDPDLEIANATATSVANTLSEVDGYRWWGGGFNIHANKNGCFEYTRDGKTMYFDLSLVDLEPAPGGSDPFKSALKF